MNALFIGIEKLSNLMFRGVEICASIKAPQEVIKSFPTQEEMKIATQELLKLADNISNLP